LEKEKDGNKDVVGMQMERSVWIGDSILEVETQGLGGGPDGNWVGKERGETLGWLWHI
jgi:hypothetical protein